MALEPGMTITTRSRIRYVVRCDGYWLGDAKEQRHDLEARLTWQNT